MRRIRTLLALLDRESARRLTLTVPVSVFLAALESLGLVLLFPIVSALANPSSLHGGGLIGRVYDLSGVTTTNGFVARAGVLVLALLVLRVTLQVAFLHWQSGVLATADARLTSRLFTEYLSKDVTFHGRRNSAELVYIVRKVTPNAIWNSMLPAVSLVTDTFVLLALVVTLLAVDPAGAVSAAAVLTAAGLLYLGLISRRYRRFSTLVLEVESGEQRLLQEGLLGIKVLKVLGRVQGVADTFQRTRQETALYERRVRFGGQLPRFFLEVALMSALAVIIAITLFRSEGPEAVASLGLLAAGGFRMVPAFQRVLTGINTMHTAEPFVDRMIGEFELLRAQAPDPGDTVADPVQFDGAMELRGLWFTYPERGQPALADVELTIHKGEFVGVVGPSGAGKSTLADILLGLLTPSSGTFAVDGEPIAGERIAGWRRIVGYVPQETFIFDDTLRANIALGLSPEVVDEKRLHDAIVAARLDEVVAELPDGIESVLGESGSRLSGGQRQRVGLARALYDKPQVLVLDEATSSLDGVTEAAIADTIEELTQSVTVIVIAHRLSTVKRCDRLVHLDGGRVLSIGTFAELIRSDPRFRAQATAAGVPGVDNSEEAG
ncbi:MAG: ATP-binding cassette, subfamily bacterial PglK [Acidimicrobiaceae bacterium]